MILRLIFLHKLFHGRLDVVREEQVGIANSDLGVVQLGKLDVAVPVAH